MSNAVLFIYRFILLLQKFKIPIIPSLINKVCLRIIFGVQIGIGAKFGKGVSLGYGGLGTVIHSRAVIGDYVRIGTNVTIGDYKKI